MIQPGALPGQGEHDARVLLVHLAGANHQPLDEQLDPEDTATLPRLRPLDGPGRDPAPARTPLRELALRQGGRVSAEIRSIELTEGWSSPFTGNDMRKLVRVTVRRGARRLLHENFVGATHAEALRALALCMERGYPEKTQDEVTG
jgi:hypothetical protein